MIDLPVLKIGCGNLWDDEVQDFLVECVPEYLCPVCKHNKSAVLAHAAAHQKEMERLWSMHLSGSWEESARDAVLAVAGLKDLEAAK